MGFPSGFRQWVKHLQHRSLVLVTDCHPGTKVFWSVLWGSGSWAGEALTCSGAECTLPRFPVPESGIGALGKPGIIQQVRVVEEAPEGILVVTERGGHPDFLSRGAISLGACRW